MGLAVLDAVPFNAEPSSLPDLTAHYLTPKSLVFQRNHGPFVLLDESQSIPVTIESHISKRISPRSLLLSELRQREQVSSTVTLQCAGNRRKEMSTQKHETEGLQWGSGTIANCLWTGPLLAPILQEMGISLDQTVDAEERQRWENAHVEFVSDQVCQEDERFASSIPLSEILSGACPVMLALKMNSDDLPLEHGGPLRIIAPGLIGARSVKWLCRIHIRSKESQNFYMQYDYKKLPPCADADTKTDWMEKTPALAHFSLHSVITQPEPGSGVKSTVKVQGYATSGTGKRIASVQIAIVTQEEGASEDAIKDDAEKSDDWQEATLVQDAGSDSQQWGWCLFSLDVNLEAHKAQSKIALISRATLVDGTRQVKKAEWNLRGLEHCDWSVVRSISIV
ncbi:uncharacterized protein L969DRAFT_87572 [Mixia osmundae IAM 14324]|uniref:Oxidoreductase molybdopterin-binding domain-containing protein n=1 Tax=Mixia osmundae (strain CBS 9802 / IAM 14324 / JCM 22182 / KY 12970) TaxID=764103 RepID=G7DVU4_MIXOS|nr:uncharacterized protein L969DRAFT_87572 [Mixia osmundae IAM 14324]KEI39617.1 hypothetical protein L969DRAFT_87572 [Mixia osmundae IAM 14324]GAA94704.1 hypothetical protein E5Q_01357 [Mixia osmundae IAM 14324]